MPQILEGLWLRNRDFLAAWDRPLPYLAALDAGEVVELDAATVAGALHRVSPRAAEVFFAECRAARQARRNAPTYRYDGRTHELVDVEPSA